MIAPPRLRILVFGAGAIGSYVGGSLALNHQKVVFLDRPAVIDQLRLNGIKIVFPEKKDNFGKGTTFLLEPSAFEVAPSIEEALRCGPLDIVIFALKSYDTDAALTSLVPVLASLPPFLCLQNGVDNENVLVTTLGATKVIAGTVTSAIGRLAPGEVIVEKRRGIGIALTHPQSQQLASTFQAAGLNARLFPDPAAMKWSKMLTNLIANASAAILGMPPGEIFAHSGLFKIEVKQLRECLSVMASLKIPVVDLPGTPARALAIAVKHLPENLARVILQKAVGGGRGGKMPSLYLDLQSGRQQSEVDYLNGAVIRYGEKTGVQTPVNRFLRDTLLSMVRGEISPLQYARQPEKLIAELGIKGYPTVP